MHGTDTQGRATESAAPRVVGAAATGTRVREIAIAHDFDAAGIAELRPSDHAMLYREWIAAGRHGSMEYMARPDAVETRLDPATRFAGLRSALVAALYYDASDDGAAGDASRGVISRYARGRDYHRVLKKKLLAVLHAIESEVGHELPLARAYVDTGPVLERELARRAGLGWFGRNTMLLHPRRGSYFFIGTLLLELDLEPSEPFDRDHCGRCTACVDNCPTGALLGRDENGAPIMDARRCISYLTIENRGAIPRELRPLIGNRVFGCDICQSCCPWNSPKIVQIAKEPDYRPHWREAEDRPDVPATLPDTEAASLVELMRMTRDEWDAWTRGSAIRRAGYEGLKRNVAVALGNWLAGVEKAPAEAVAVLREALGEESELIREHAAWALERSGQ